MIDKVNVLTPARPSTATVFLPDPDQFPGRPVVIWDGECNFCRRQVEQLHRLDWTGQLAFISLHDARVSQRYAQLSYAQLMEQMWVIAPSKAPLADQLRYGGADALRYLTRRLPALWLLAPVMHLPLSMPLWRAIYGWVARRRYRLAGKACDGGTCHLHK